MDKQSVPQKLSVKAWLKKIGLVGFLFFLLKGLLWLAIGYFVTQ